MAGCRHVNPKLDQAFDQAITQASEMLNLNPKITSMQKIILRVGAEGGDLTLYGFRRASGWLFSLSVYDCTPVLVDEGEPAIKHISSGVTLWADAIALLDAYPWAELHPLTVHPDFRKQVWNEVESRLDPKRDEHYLDQWRRICEVSLQPL